MITRPSRPTSTSSGRMGRMRPRAEISIRTSGSSSAVTDAKRPSSVAAATAICATV